MIALLTHVVSLRSLGVPYMYPLAPLDLKALRDVLLRSPKWDFQSRRLAVHLPEDEGSD
jgi:spore germination protein KA